MVPIISDENYRFTYDKSKSVDENFTTWRILNHEERSAYGDDLLSLEKAQEVFETQYSVTVKNG